jgi:hypothetical protein
LNPKNPEWYSSEVAPIYVKFGGIWELEPLEHE